MRVGIVAYEGADELDVVAPHRILGAAGFDVEVVAEERGEVALSEGLVVAATGDFTTCPPLDVLLVTGGSSTETDRGRRVQQRNERLLAFVRDRGANAQLVSAVCTGAFILAEAGLLAGRRVNTHWQYRDELDELMRRRGEPVEIVAERVVWDGDLVTCGGVTSAIDLSLDVVAHCLGEDHRRAVDAVLERSTPAVDDRARAQMMQTR